MSLSSSSRCTADVSSVIPTPSDVAVDTLGKFVAVAGENGHVAVADLGSSASIATSFQAHSGCIVRIAWAHHRFGRVLVTACEAGEFAVWSGAAGGERGEPTAFKKVYGGAQQRQLNSVAWAPHEYGLMFALAWGDGQVIILCARDAEMAQWDQQSFMAHGGGCHAVSWSPAAAPGTLLQMPLGVPQAPGTSAAQAQQAQQQQQITMPSPRVVTCGPERSVRVWRYIAQDRHWLQEQELAELPPQVLLVRDVAWSPNPGLPFGYIAAGSDDGFVGVWRQDGCDGRWNYAPLGKQFASAVCRVGWSAAGSLVHVSCADGGSSVWKEDPSGEWVCAFATDAQH